MGPPNRDCRLQLATTATTSSCRRPWLRRFAVSGARERPRSLNAARTARRCLGEHASGIGFRVTSAAAADVLETTTGAAGHLRGQHSGAATTRRPRMCLLNDGSGHFTRRLDLLPPDIEDVDAGRYTRSLFVDVNRDGFPDLVLGAENNTPNSRVLLNDGTGHFHDAPAPLPAKPFGPTSILISLVTLDVDRDGLPDLLAGFQHADFTGRQIQVLINAGNGMFRDETAQRLPCAGCRARLAVRDPACRLQRRRPARLHRPRLRGRRAHTPLPRRRERRFPNGRIRPGNADLRHPRRKLQLPPGHLLNLLRQRRRARTPRRAAANRGSGQTHPAPGREPAQANQPDMAPCPSRRSVRGLALIRHQQTPADRPQRRPSFHRPTDEIGHHVQLPGAGVNQASRGPFSSAMRARRR